MITLTLFVSFGILTAAVLLAPRAVQHIDTAIEKRLSFFATPRWTRFFKPITFFGSAGGIIGFAILATFTAPLDVVVMTKLVVVLGGSTLMAQIVKQVAARVRPREHAWLPPFPQYSFPSGHTTAATALYGFLGLFWYALFPLPIFLIVAIGIILAVGFSRLTLSAHFALDVLGGFLLGGFWVALALGL